jgi:outer membrane biosynthesis protein TonB
MAGPIQTAIASLEQGQKPAWLDAGSQPVTQTSPNENLNHAREILQHNTQDEINRHNELAAQPPKPQEPPAPAAPPPASKPEEQPHRKPDAQPRRDPQRKQEMINTLAGTIGTILSGGKVPPPAVGGAASPADPFAGTWACRGTITSQRNANVRVGNPTSVIRISRSGNGYVMDSNAGPIPSTSVSGNHIVFSARVGRSDSWQATSDDLSVTGNRMTGIERMTNSDGAEVIASLDCTRQ